MPTIFKQIATLALAFIFGSLCTYLWMTKKQMDAVLSPAASKVANHHVIEEVPANSSLPTTAIAVDNSKNKAINPSTFDAQVAPSLGDYTQEQAQAIVDDMPNMVLEQYIDKFMAKDASDLLADKRQFAKRAIEELYSQNDTTKLVGDIKLSQTDVMPEQSMDTSTVDKSATLYAHLDTFGRVSTGAQVFIKWVNNTTGQVLLFEKKEVLADSNQNWVSMKPYDGWQVGSYDIRFYQFTSELEPVAQLTYHINQVQDTDTPDTNGTGLSSAIAQSTN